MPYYDEVFDGGGAPRAHAAALAAALDALGHDGLVEAGHRRDTIFMRQGITFEVGGADGDEPRSTARSRSTSCRGSCRSTSGARSSAASPSGSGR